MRNHQRKKDVERDVDEVAALYWRNPTLVGGVNCIRLPRRMLDILIGACLDHGADGVYLLSPILDEDLVLTIQAFELLH